MTGPVKRRSTINLRAVALSLAAVLLCGHMAPPLAKAVLPDEFLADASLESRARALSKQLRCLVCQNQSIDNSDAELARDLRILVRERLKAGDSDTQVMAFLVARYGDFILLKPPVKPATWLLWFGPLAIFVAAGLAIMIAVSWRKRFPKSTPTALSQLERAALARILDHDGSGTQDGGGDDTNGGQPDGRSV